jgi:NAD(P)H-nitrite reductase large subunit
LPATQDWVPLRPATFYPDNGIELHLGANVTGVDARSQEVTLAEGSKIRYDRLLLATGAEPVRLSIPGAEQPHVCPLRSLADCRAIIARAETAGPSCWGRPAGGTGADRQNWKRCRSRRPPTTNRHRIHARGCGH